MAYQGCTRLYRLCEVEVEYSPDKSDKLLSRVIIIKLIILSNLVWNNIAAHILETKRYSFPLF